MAIHYENYKMFSKGQGFIGSACRPISAQATSTRWLAVDCRDCKNTVADRNIVNRDGLTARVTAVTADGVEVECLGLGNGFVITWKEMDTNWAPLNLGEIFGESE